MASAYKQGAVKRADYTFSAANKTITFSQNYIGLELSEIFFIDNVVSNIVIYNPSSTATNGTLNGLLLTLAFDTSAMSDRDTLRIITGSSNSPTLISGLVSIIDNQAQLDEYDDVAAIRAGIEQLAMSQDASEQMPIRTNDPSILKDVDGNLLLNEMSLPLYGANYLAAGGKVILVDTKGYKSLIIQCILNGSSSTFTCNISNDGVTFTQQSFISLGTGINGAIATAFSPTAGNLFLCPCSARYIQINITTGSSAGFKVLCYLRTTDIMTQFAIQGVNSNVLFSGTAPVTAGIAGTLAVGGNVAQGAPRTENPLPIAGVDANNLTKTILTDISGRLLLAGIDINTQGLSSSVTGVGQPYGNRLNVIDRTENEGVNQPEIMDMILKELKILNLYMSELPYTLNRAFQTNVDPIPQSPDDLRDDPYFDIRNQN
jgi:hypothetical protein